MFSLDAAEWLVDDSLPSLATRHLHEIEKRDAEDALRDEVKARLQMLRLRILDAMCDLDGAVAFASGALAVKDGSNQTAIAAERREISYLRGDFNAVLNEKLENRV